jgi:hypothetical protein
METSIELETSPYSSACLYAKQIGRTTQDIMPMRQFVHVLKSKAPILGYNSVPASAKYTVRYLHNNNNLSLALASGVPHAFRQLNTRDGAIEFTSNVVSQQQTNTRTGHDTSAHSRRWSTICGKPFMHWYGMHSDSEGKPHPTSNRR